MKKYILILIMLSTPVMAESTRTNLGKISTVLGKQVAVMTVERRGEVGLYLYVTDKYRIKKILVGMDIYKTKRLREMLNIAIDKMEGTEDGN